MKKVFLITRSNYPFGDANGYRFFTLAQMCEAAGYEPRVLCMGKDHHAVETSQYQAKSFYVNTKNPVNKGVVYFTLMTNCIREMDKTDDIAAVICSTMMFAGDFRRLQRYCYGRGISLLYSAVEWYSPEQFKSRFAWDYVKCNLYHEKVIPDKKTKVIAISRYLQNYYEGKGTQCAYIPSIVDTAKTVMNKRVAKERVSIMYAGAPGKKDYIGHVISACCLLDQKELSKLELRIFGITKKQLLEDCGVTAEEIEYLGEALTCFGRVPRDRVMLEYETSNFSILIRPQDMRYAKAGFPTKFAESMMTGTPVICNLTSDLADFCINGSNSVVVENESKEKISDAIRMAINTPYEQRLEMCNHARETAVSSFDYHVYIDDLKRLLE